MQISSGPIGSIDPSKDTRIYGAGVSGLLIGFYLKKKGITRFEIFEKTSKVGGKIGTELSSHGPIESAANAIYTNDDVYELLAELNLKPIAATEKLKKKVWRFGKVLSPPIKITEILRALLNLFKKCPSPTSEGLTVYAFFRPWLGEKLSFELLSAVLGGIYATDSKSLDFQSIFKLKTFPKTYWQFIKMMKAKREANKTKATSVSFDQGMQQFINAFSAELSDHLQLDNSPELDPNYNNIICTDALDAATLIEKDHPFIAQELRTIEYTPLQTTTIFLDNPIVDLSRSFGILFPPQQSHRLLGILHNSAIFKREGHSYTFITKSEDPLQEVDKGLELLKSPTNIVHKKSTLWEKAIPLYNHQRTQAVLSIRSQFINIPTGLVLFGNYVDGISIREMISHAKQFCQNLD
jgi:oxygen-dependent protoporphyrinogen oxidase